MGAKSDASRAARHAQTPVMRGQVSSLRTFALAASERAGDVNSTNQAIGELLTSNMAAGFALELALKLFFMTFHEDAPENTHRLERLWQKLPSEWRSEVDRVYREDPRSASPVHLLALQRADTPPPVPQDYKRPRLSTADSLFASLSETFVSSRYFYERVAAGEWAVAEHPIGQTMAMLDVLTAFYDYLLNEGNAQGSASQ